MSAVAEPQSAPRPTPLFFQVTVRKLVLMSVFTWGGYELVWAYFNWEIIRERSGRNFSPAIRSIVLGGPFLFPLLAAMRREALARGARPVPVPYVLAGLALLLSLAGFLGGWYFLITFLAVGPLALAQSRVNELHAHVGLDPSVNGRFSLVNLIFMVIGGALLVYTCWPLGVWLLRVATWYLGGRGAT